MQTYKEKKQDKSYVLIPYIITRYGITWLRTNMMSKGLEKKKSVNYKEFNDWWANLQQLMLPDSLN
jgi:hypothetical protein